MPRMKIAKVGDKDSAIEIPSSNIDEFKEEWKKQGGTIVEEKDMELVVKNKDGKIIHLFVVGNIIFPFDFEEDKKSA